MPCEILWHPREILRHFHGIITGRELLATISAITSDERLDTIFWVIDDFSEVTDLAVGLDDLDDSRALCLGLSLTRPMLRTAVVLPPGPLGGTLAYLLGPLLGPQSHLPDRYRCFTHIHAARRWAQGALDFWLQNPSPGG